MLSSDPFIAVEKALEPEELEKVQAAFDLVPAYTRVSPSDVLGELFERDQFLIFTEPCSVRGQAVVRELSAGEMDPSWAAGRIHEVWTAAVIVAGVLLAADGIHRFATGGIISDLADEAERITRLAVEGDPE